MTILLPTVTTKCDWILILKKRRWITWPCPHHHHHWSWSVIFNFGHRSYLQQQERGFMFSMRSWRLPHQKQKEQELHHPHKSDSLMTVTRLPFGPRHAHGLHRLKVQPDRILLSIHLNEEWGETYLLLDADWPLDGLSFRKYNRCLFGYITISCRGGSARLRWAQGQLQHKAQCLLAN